MKYILASKSPRRKELMKSISPVFDIITKEINEETSYNLSPIDAVKDIAYRKGKEIAANNPNTIVISADTIVVLDNKIIGKPKNPANAVEILNALNNKIHYVYTGFAVFFNKKVINEVVSTEVVFENLTPGLINEYVDSKSPLDKAGAYGIQDNDRFHIIKKIQGSYDNVVGFPVSEIKDAIKRII